MKVFYFSRWYPVTVLRSTPKRKLVQFTTKGGRVYERWVPHRRVRTPEEQAKLNRIVHPLA